MFWTELTQWLTYWLTQKYSCIFLCAKEEEREFEKLEKENLKIIEGVYNALTKDKEIQKQIKKIKEHEWVKVVEGNL